MPNNHRRSGEKNSEVSLLDKSLKHLILVSHTHWDREWYLPFEDFRWQLVKTVDQLPQLPS